MYIYIYAYVYSFTTRYALEDSAALRRNLPTKIIPTKIARLRLSWKSPMDMRIPPVIIKIMLESNPLKSIMLVRILAVSPR